MAKPKLALIPATQGSKLYSVLPADGVGDFTFSRNSAATRINKDGLIETVAVGKSRLNYPLIDGVVNGCPSHLLEPSRLQKIQYSEAFDNAYWTKSGLLTPTSGFVSPKGDLSAFKLVEDTSNSSHSLQSSYVGAASGADTFSVFAKSDGRFNFSIVEDAYTGINVIVNLQDGTITTTAQQANIISLKNGWYRIDVTRADNSNPSRWLISLLDSSNNASYQGDGTSGIYVWGAQAEAGSYPTSYIPNYGTSAGITRVAETANGAGDASTFNSSEGVLMAEYSDFDNDSFRQLTVSNSSNSNAISIMNTTTENQVVCFVNNGGVTQASISTILNSTHEFNKIAIKYKANDFSVYINGFERGTDTSGTVPTGLNTLNFDNGSSSGDVYGSAKQIQYFDTALNDSDLETLTSWTSFTDLANGQTYSIK